MNDMLVLHVRQFKSDDVVKDAHQANSPTIYNDGTVEIMVDLTDDGAVYIRFSVADLVQIAMTHESVEAPE